MPTATLLAQAKINLSLRILAREATGYHQLETLYCRIALGDEVRVTVGGTTRALRLSGEALPQTGLGPTESNLAWRAAAAYAAATGWPDGFEIEIVKRIPVGGGLGGGSADAGGVLRALNALNPKPLSPGELLAIADTLGSDVPFLTQSESTLALAWSRGNRLLALPHLSERRVLLFVFGHGVPTRDAYAWLARTPPAPHSAGLLEPHELATWRGVSRTAHNDFESVVLPRFRLIDLTLTGARKGIAAGELGPDAMALLSGSGSSVFVILGDETERSWHRMFPLSAGVKLQHTRTSARVEPVTVID